MLLKSACTCLLFLFSLLLHGQHSRVQYPSFLSKAYFGVSPGYIQYPFTSAHLEDPFTAESVHIPHAAVKITLLGYRFSDRLSAHITYMRPVNWVEYRQINNMPSARSVYMNTGGLTLMGNFPVGKKLQVYGEGGLGIITRNGFEMDGQVAVKDASYATFLMGVGLDYLLSGKWVLTAGMNYAPGHSRHKQPHTLFYGMGFRYRMNPLPQEKVEENLRGGYSFPKNLVQLAYTTNALGYGVNAFFSEGIIPVFWGGDAEVQRGLAVNYQRNIFHTRKVFSLDIGASLGIWKSNELSQDFFTASVYPLFRFTLLRTRPADLYFYYSVAGPSFISRVLIDEEDTGRKFTFRDFMGTGIYFGKNRNLNAEVNIGHFSNGNLFPKNAGVKVPLSFNIGYTFGRD